MQTHQLYALAALERVQQFLDSNGVVLGSLSNTPARKQLDAAVTQLGSESVGQSTAVRQAQGQITQQRQLVETLRTNHMQPIAKFARASLKGAPGFAALTNTGHRLQGMALVVAARAMATAAAPYAAQLTEAQFPADEPEQLSAAADAVASAISDRAGSKSQRVTATAGIKQSLASGRQAVTMLDPVVSKMLAGNAGLLAGWRVAKRIVAKPGVVSAAAVTLSAPSNGPAAAGTIAGSATAAPEHTLSPSNGAATPMAKAA